MKKALRVSGLSAGGLVVLGILFVGYMYLTTGIPSALASAEQQDNIVTYSNGTTEIGTIGRINRTDLSLNQIPVTLQDAFIAAEDKNFYHEGGVSPTGILRAIGSDLVSSGGSLNGGSTLTQEFVRNYYGLGLQQTATRKIKEIIISEKLAGVKSKPWILDHYLNMVFLGENSYGVQAAAQTYFGKSATKLTLAQQAVLAGLPQQPSTFPLVQYKAQLQARWRYVLDQMVKDNYISQATADAQKFPTLLTWSDPNRGAMASDVNPADSNPWDYYVLGMVQNELKSDGITPGDLNLGGYKIVTNLNYKMQKEMYDAVDNVLSPSNLAANGSRLPKLPPWVMTGSEVQQPGTGAIVAMYPGKGLNQTSADCQQNTCFEDTVQKITEQVGSSFKPYVVAAAVQQGMNAQSSVLDTSSYACIAPPSMGSTIFTQPVTKAIYTQATSALGSNATTPSPSSSTGCPAGYFPEENDSGESIGKPVYTPPSGNYAGAVYAQDNVQDALAQSSNVAFTDLIHKTGTVAPEKIAEEVGTDSSAFKGDLGRSVGVALGEAQMTVQNQASLVAMLADNGTYHQAHLIKSWDDTTGTTSSGVQTPKVSTTQVLTPAQASQVQYAMEMTTVNGTAKGLVTLPDPSNQGIIGKTGTTTSNHSGFFVGATPQFAMAVGMHTASITDKSQNLGMLDSSNAANIYPTMIWNEFANAAFSTAAPQTFPPINTAGTQPWNMFPALPKPPKPKPQPKPTQQPTCPGGGAFGGLFGGHGKKGGNGNCQQNNQPSTAPTTPAPTPSCPTGGGGGLFGGGGGGNCPSTPTAGATPGTGTGPNSGQTPPSNPNG